MNALKRLWLRYIWGNSFGRITITGGKLHVGPNPYTGSGDQPPPKGK